MGDEENKSGKQFQYLDLKFNKLGKVSTKYKFSCHKRLMHCVRKFTNCNLNYDSIKGFTKDFTTTIKESSHSLKFLIKNQRIGLTFTEEKNDNKFTAQIGKTIKKNSYNANLLFASKFKYLGNAKIQCKFVPMGKNTYKKERTNKSFISIQSSPKFSTFIELIKLTYYPFEANLKSLYRINFPKNYKVAIESEYLLKSKQIDFLKIDLKKQINPSLKLNLVGKLKRERKELDPKLFSISLGQKIEKDTNANLNIRYNLQKDELKGDINYDTKIHKKTDLFIKLASDGIMNLSLHNRFTKKFKIIISSKFDLNTFDLPLIGISLVNTEHIKI